MRNLLVIRLHFDNFQQYFQIFKNSKVRTFQNLTKLRKPIRLFLKIRKIKKKKRN